MSPPPAAPSSSSARQQTCQGALPVTTVIRTCGIARERDCSSGGKPYDSGTLSLEHDCQTKKGVPVNAGFMHAWRGPCWLRWAGFAVIGPADTAPGLGRRRRSSRHGLTSSLSCSTTRRAATTRPASVAGPPGHAVPIGGLSAGDMLGTGVRSRVRMGGHAAISDGSLAASEAGGISGSGVRRALALFGALGPERSDPDRWNEQAVYPGFGVILPGALEGPQFRPAQLGGVHGRGIGDGCCAADQGPLDRSQSPRCATCATRGGVHPRSGILNPDGPHRAPANVMLRPRLPPDVGPATGG